jgi:hypothetical protein
MKRLPISASPHARSGLVPPRTSLSTPRPSSRAWLRRTACGSCRGWPRVFRVGGGMSILNTGLLWFDVQSAGKQNVIVASSLRQPEPPCRRKGDHPTYSSMVRACYAVVQERDSVRGKLSKYRTYNFLVSRNQSLATRSRNSMYRRTRSRIVSSMWPNANESCGLRISIDSIL